ncbi:hypothetical protein PVAND_017201 [Polypedilum vanderplanki]|uniref:Uncharacterized protein n=1 Tax=Polypedilum vanderplanki TaxID=319348 RepID=A0A9J6BHE8_POLVA|nr:hypothetical protein PVAND_017201 [Polypedilum vanderplanki]
MAPMVRVGTLPMRLLALEMGADLVYTEELIDFKLLKCKRIENKVLNTIDFVDESEGNNVVFRTCEKEKSKVILQIGTADVGRAVRAAKLVENDVAGIDINMGCPKEFSVKGGMGVALAANLPKAKQILSTLVKALKIPVTCKIRIKKTVEETIEHVKELETTGISAIAIHARTRDERPHHKPHPEVIKAVCQEVKIPVICNGGSKEIEKHSDIYKYKELCGASSIMIARAAQWNVSIFKKDGKMEPVLDVIQKYLKYAIDYDSTAMNTKYCIQNILLSLQESEMGRRFLDAQIMEQIAEVFGMKEYCKKKQLEQQMKQAELEQQENEISNDIEPLKKRLKLIDDDTIVENIYFIRSNYGESHDLPKSILHLFLLKNSPNLKPKYKIEKDGIHFRATLELNGKKYVSTSLEKNKKTAEQCASLVACLHLGLVTKQELIANGSMKIIES